MAVPHYINEHKSDLRGKPGWYAMEGNGKPSFGPFPSYEECLTRITQPNSNFLASPWWQTRQSRIAPAADPANGRATS
jgi:hypothetical protein